MKKLIFVILLLSSVFGYGQTLDTTYVRGVVAACHDGDSYKIRFEKDTIWVRLAFVDAPEVNSNRICATQEMGREIGDFVRSELKGKTVYVKFLATDQYNRPVVRVNYNDQDYSTRLVMKGLAWVVDTKELSNEEYKILAEYKKLAFKNRLGIFINSKAITPALFRKRNRCSDKTDSK